MLDLDQVDVLPWPERSFDARGGETDRMNIGNVREALRAPRESRAARAARAASAILRSVPIPPLVVAYALPAVVGAIVVQLWFRDDSALASGDLVPPVAPSDAYRSHW